MSRKRRTGNWLNGLLVVLAALVFLVSVFSAGLWAGMHLTTGNATPVAGAQTAPETGTWQAAEAPAPSSRLSPVRETPDPEAPASPDPEAMRRLVASLDGGTPQAPEPAFPASPVPGSEAPVWMRHAAAAPEIAGRPMIAVVIDDMGVDRLRSKAVVALPGPLTLSWLTYADDLAGQTAAARARGHELMMHVPMQPKSADVDPGPNALLVQDAPGELARKLAWGLSRFDGYVGANNHMGSRFTGDRAGMDMVMEALGRRGVFFLDSVTAPETTGPAAAVAAGLPVLKRDVFLDNGDTIAEVLFRLEQAEKIARRTGAAIAIGHPYDSTITVLREWLPEARARGFAVVPLTAILRHRYPRFRSAGREQ